METKKKIRKTAPSSSSSSDSESSSSSSSEETRRKQKHRNIRKQQRESSSSSENEAIRKAHKHGSHKKSNRKHSHSAKVRAKMVQSSGKKKRSLSPASRLAHKHHLKVKISTKKVKLAHMEDIERRSRTPTRRDVKKDRTPDHRIASPTTRIRVSVPNNRVIRERSAGRGLKDSTSISRRHIREPAGDKERAEILARCQERQRERDRLKRMQEEEERFKHGGSRIPDRSRIVASSHVALDKHRHERSRSPSRGKIPIRERLDKESYDFRRSNSREHEDYPIMRPAPISAREPIRAYSRDRPALRDEPERNFDYRTDDRRVANHDYGPPARVYEDRHHHRAPNWENEREVEPRSGRIYEGRDWEAGHSKRIPDEPYKDNRDRTWNDLPHDKWSKEKDTKEWSRSWKEPSGSVHSISSPTISHPRRWPAPGQTESWTPRGSHPSSRKIDHPSTSSSGPPFKPRFGGSSPHFGFKRFPFKRFPNLYSKINYSSRRVIPSSATSTTSSVSGSIIRPPLKGSDNSVDFQMKSEDHMTSTANKVDATESGEITTEPEEDKVEADTTFSGNLDTQSQEEEGNLSEFSDIDDEILNREEIEDAAPSRKMGGRASTSLRLQSNAHELARGVASELNASADDQTNDQNDLKIISKIHANKELKKEMDLDFEEISDGELEEESRIKGLGDALGVDWASLAKETQLPIKHEPDEFLSSTKSRWTPHRILWDIGVSSKLAGEEFARRMLTEARNELRREKQELLTKMAQLNTDKSQLHNGEVKQELAVVGEGADEVKIKTEPKDEEEQEVKQEVKEESTNVELPEDDFELDDDVLKHPLAPVQVLLRKLQMKRKNLILHSTGKYGRALSARRDLKIRRQLCNLPTRDIKINRSCATNPELQKNVDEIYRRLIGEVS